MSDHLLAQVLAGVFAILAAVLGGISIKNRASTSKRQGALDDVEGGIFKSALSTMKEDRDRWHKSADEAWAIVDDVRKTNEKLRVQVAQLRLQFKLVRKYPEIAGEFTSIPGDLDSQPMLVLEPAVTVLPVSDTDNTG